MDPFETRLAPQYSIDPRLVQLARLNPNNKQLQNMMLQAYLSSGEQQQQQQMMASIFGGGGMGGGLDSGIDYKPTNPLYDRSIGRERSIGQELPTDYELPADVEPEKKNFLEKVVSVLVDPALQYGKWMGEGIPYLASTGLDINKRILESAMKGDIGIDPTIDAFAKTTAQQDYQPWLYEKEEWDKISHDPMAAVEEGTKAGAAIGSYIPMAMGVPTSAVAAAGAGALGGGMLSASQQEDLFSEEGIKGTAYGGALGGMFGAGGYGLGRGIGWVGEKLGKGKLGTGLEQSGMGIKTPKTPTGVLDAEDLTAGVKRITTAKEVGTGAKDIGIAFKGLDDDLSKALIKGGKNFNRAEFVDEAVETVVRDYGVNPERARAMIDTVVNKGTGTGSSITGKGLLEVKTQNYGASQAVYKAEHGLSAGSISDKIAVKGVIHNLAKDRIHLIPQTQKILADMSLLHQVAPDIVTALDKGKWIGAPMLMSGVKVPFPAGNIIGGITKTAGKALGGIPGVLSGIGQKAPQMGFAGAMLGRIPAVSGGKTQEVGQPSGMGQAGTERMGAGQMGMGQPSGLGYNKEALAMAVMSGQMDVQTAKFIADMYEGGDAKQTNKQKSYSSAAELADEALATIEGSGVYSGPFASTWAKIGEKTGLQSTEQTEYRALVAAARTSIRNALLGAHMSEAEMESLDPLIPEFTDAPSVVKDKLRVFAKTARVLAGKSGDSESEGIAGDYGY